MIREMQRRRSHTCISSCVKNGTALDAYPYLVNVIGGWDGRFRDDDGNVHEENIDIIAGWGITIGCNPPLNNMFCPGDHITRGQMAAFIAPPSSSPDGVTSLTPTLQEPRSRLL